MMIIRATGSRLDSGIDMFGRSELAGSTKPAKRRELRVGPREE